MDSVELDYNGDGITDYVGVQEVPRDVEKGEVGYDSTDFRILFAIESEGPGQYRLDFQNENLIPTWDEGGPFGDPYEPLTAEGNSLLPALLAEAHGSGQRRIPILTGTEPGI